MSDKIFKINLSEYGGPIFTGRNKGEKIAKILALSEKESVYDKISTVIPPETWSVNSSFFLGIFGDRIKEFNDIDKFLKKYEFICSEQIENSIREHIKLGLLSLKKLV